MFRHQMIKKYRNGGKVVVNGWLIHMLIHMVAFGLQLQYSLTSVGRTERGTLIRTTTTAARLD